MGYAKGLTNPWVGGVLLVVLTISRFWLSWAKCPTNPWVGGVLLSVFEYKGLKQGLKFCAVNKFKNIMKETFIDSMSFQG